MTTLADALERLLLSEPGQSADELYQRLGSTQSKVNGAEVVGTVLGTQPDRFVETTPGRFASTATVDASAEWTTSSSESWRELEWELRDRLRGNSMVSEIGLDAKLLQQVEPALAEVVRVAENPQEVARRARGLLVVALVAHGIYRYESGDYWSGFLITGIDQRYGKAFAEAIERLDMESFDDLVANDNAHRYVAPILAHGGVPQSSLERVFEMIADGLEQGATDAIGLLTLWRGRASAFAGTRPVKRFLLYGGEVATDFLGRCIELTMEWERTQRLPTPVEVGLPPYVLKGFRDMVSAGGLKGRSLRPTRPGTVQPTPVLRCDPWDLLGPRVELPPLVGFGAGDYWTISSPAGVQRERTSTSDMRAIEVDPHRQWEVKLSQDGHVVSETAFEGLDSVAALLFDPKTAQHFSLGVGLRGDEVWVIRPPETELRCIRISEPEPVKVREQFPELSGAWSGYLFERIDLKDCRALLIDEQRVSVRSFERPTLAGERVDGGTGADGSTVFAAEPGLYLPASTIPWTVRITVERETQTQTYEGDRHVDIGELLPPNRAATVSLTARAALGSDLRTDFTWVPGLIVERPEDLALPSDPPPTLEVSTMGVPRLGLPNELGVSIQAEDVSDSIDLRFPSADGEVGIRVQIPRLRWGLVRDGRCNFGISPLRMSNLDIEGDQPPGLAVSTGAANLAMELVLTAGGESLQRSDKARSAGAVGQCRFDLGRFSDTIGQLDESAEFHLWLGHGRHRVPVGTVEPTSEFADLVVETIHTDASMLLSATFTENRPLKRRVLRLWSQGRVWEEAEVLTIPDDAHGEVTLVVEPAPPAGEYLVELAVDHGWAAPVRPLEAAAGVASVSLGDSGQAWHGLMKRVSTDALAVIESINTQGYPLRELEESELKVIVRPAMLSWSALCRAPTLRGLQERSLGSLVEVIGRASEELPAVVDELAGDDELGPAELLRLTVMVAGRVPPRQHSTGHGGLAGAGIRSLWQLATALAALIELDIGGDGDSANPAEFLGWTPEDGIDALPPAPPVDQVWLGMDLAQLEGIEKHLQQELFPKPLAKGGAVEPRFEWLRADKVAGGGLVSQWMSAHHRLRQRPAPTSEAIRAALNGRGVDAHTESWGAFPQVTLTAALHIFGDTNSAVLAERALIAALEFAPLQVQRDLIVARILMLDLLRVCDLHEVPTERVI